MAFPTVTSTAVTTTGGTASANPQVLMPPTVNVGDIIISLLRKDNEAEMTWPGGWLKEIGDASDGADDQTSCAWKWADGTEDGTSITVATGVSGKYAALSYAIGAAGPPLFSAIVTGASTTPNPPSFSPLFGAQDYLWLWMGGWEGEQTSPPAGNPTNYTNPIGSNSGTAGAVATNARVASARRTLNTATEDPPTWTISASDDWTAFVIAVPPPQPAHIARFGAMPVQFPDPRIRERRVW